MKYEIRFWREAWNQTLHVIVGAVVTHTFLPYLELEWILSILLMLGIIRERWQHLRGKIQHPYVHILDIFTIMLGGLLWYLIVTHFNINVDLL